MYGNKIAIVAIYISEAHADDEWPLSQKVKINQTKTITSRVSIARKFCEEKKVTIPLFVDDISSPEKNTFEKIYAVWPERGFVFVDGKIEFINYAKIEQGVLWAPEIETWLAQNVK